MKKLFIIFVLFIYLSANTQLHEVFKLPTLIEHFIEHNQANPSLSFFDFLHMHYANGNVKYADYDKDMQLPFKSHHECDNFVTVFSLLPNNPQIIQPVYFHKTLFCEYNHILISSAALEAIWQPPKFC